MDLRILSDIVDINEVPLEEILINGSSISIRFDDKNEERWEMVVNPYQCFKITTIDCTNNKVYLLDNKWVPNILEMTDSNLIKELSCELKKHDIGAKFLEKAHHYVLPFQDNIIEIVAWDNYILRKI